MFDDDPAIRILKENLEFEETKLRRHPYPPPYVEAIKKKIDSYCQAIELRRKQLLEMMPPPDGGIL